MAEISGFHNSRNGDRRYKADFWARFLGSFIGNGVYPNPSTNLQVIANGDMTVTVKAGKAWVNGVFYENTADKVIELDVADGVLKRIDRIVVSDITLERDTYSKVKKGSFASTPAAPALQRDADSYELGLADIYIVNGAVSISQANITDLRLNSAYCGIVHGLFDQVDTTTLFNQYQAWLEEAKIQGESEFNAWLLELQDVLSGDIAGNLLNLINAHKSDYRLQVPYAGATAGSVNIYTISEPNISVLLEGMAVSLKFHTGSTGASTLNWCGTGAKPIKKANGMDVTNLKSTGIYTLRYDGANFILQGEGASGTAVASDLLSGKTASTDAGDITGTMTNRGAVTITPSTVNQAIAPGYHDGSGYVSGDADLIASNILSGKNIFGITGNVYEPTFAAGYNSITFPESLAGDEAFFTYSVAVGARLFAQSAVASTTYTKYGTRITMRASGTVRIKFKLTPILVNYIGFVYARIYKNGVATGVERFTVSGNSSSLEFSEDFTVNKGDYLEFYLKTSGAAGAQSKVFNVSMGFTRETMITVS